MKFLAVNVFLEPDGYYAMTLVSDPFMKQIHEFSSQSDDVELHDLRNCVLGDQESPARELVNYFLSNQLCSVRMYLEFNTLGEALGHARQQHAERLESQGPRLDIPADVHSEALNLERELHHLSKSVERAISDINRSISRYATELQKFRNSLLLKPAEEKSQGILNYESSDFSSVLALLDEQVGEKIVSPRQSITKTAKSQAISGRLDDIGLPAGITKALRDAGITNVKQLENTSDHDLMKIKGIGKSRLDSIKKSIGTVGSVKPRKKPAKENKNIENVDKSKSKGLKANRHLEGQASTYEIGNIYTGDVMSMLRHGASGFIKCDTVKANIYFRLSECSSDVREMIKRGILPPVEFRVVESNGKGGVEAASIKELN